MANIHILYGSTTGATEAAAQQLAALLGAEAKPIAAASPEDFEADLLILGSSTWGYGELQDDWALVYPSLSLLVTRSVPGAERGAGLGVFLAALDVTFAIGPPLGSAVVSAASTGAALWSAGAVCLLALPVVIAAGDPSGDLDEDPEEGLELAEDLPAPAV